MSQPDRRSALAIGLEWASRVSTIGLEFALPPLAGAYVDQRAGTSPWVTLLGVLVGFAVGMWHILRIARETQRDGTRDQGPGKNHWG